MYCYITLYDEVTYSWCIFIIKFLVKSLKLKKKMFWRARIFWIKTTQNWNNAGRGLEEIIIYSRIRMLTEKRLMQHSRLIKSISSLWQMKNHLIRSQLIHSYFVRHSKSWISFQCSWELVRYGLSHSEKEQLNKTMYWVTKVKTSWNTKYNTYRNDHKAMQFWSEITEYRK